MEQKQDKQFSRRLFLKGVPLGIAGAFVVSSISRTLFSRSRGDDKYPTFPEGSIFAPGKKQDPTDV